MNNKKPIFTECVSEYEYAKEVIDMQQRINKTLDIKQVIVVELLNKLFKGDISLKEFSRNIEDIH